MTQILTRRYLSNRFLISIAAIAISLLLVLAIGARALSSFGTHSHFSTLFAQLVEVTARLESELSWPSPQEKAAERKANLSQRYRDVLATFAALRGVDTDHLTQNDGKWAAVENTYGVNAASERAKYGLMGVDMPADLATIWHTRSEGGASLEELIDSFLTLSRAIVEAESMPGDEQAKAMQSIREMTNGALWPTFHRALLAISQSTSQSATFGIYLLMACAGAGILVTLLNSVFIFMPMQRTILENQDQLIHERDRAQASERSKRDFLAMMSHELRTPMNGILGFTNLLLSTELEAKQKDYAETIQSSGQTLLKLLNDILDISKIEAGSLQLEEADFAFSEAVADVVTLLGPQAFAKRLELSAYIDPAMPEKLKGDGGRLRQILINLVGNGIKFTVSGGVAIEVRHEGEDAGRHSVCMSVADTGIGVGKDQIAHIFDRFTQVDSSASRRFEGTGLGLSICRELTQQMGGEIGVESTLDKGSTFWVRVPLSSACPPAESISKRSSISFSGKRVLVVDDNALNRRIFKLQLEGFGADVDCVPDGRAALAALAQLEPYGRRYDVAIIDQMMPEMDGLTLRRMIREQPAYADMKLILSSSGGIVYNQQARVLGFDAACPKPVSQERLIGTIHELLQASRSDALPVAIAVLPAKPAPGVQAGGGERKQHRLLIAEDNPVNQRLLVTALKQAGYALDVVADGVEAVHAVQRLPYDVVLMDIRMPVMSGVEATQRIRSLPEPLCRQPIIAMTANAMAGDREEYMAAGMNDYVAKPIDFNVLLAKISALLPTKAGVDAAETDEGAQEPEKRRV